MVAAPGLDASLVDRLSAEEWREALRACKGKSLREEIFAHDAPSSGATPEEIRRQLSPYSVTASSYVVQLLQPRGTNAHAVFVWDEDRHYVAVNDEACRITGLDREDLLRMEVGALTDDGASPQFEQAQRAGRLTGRSAFTRRDGTRVVIEYLTLHTTVAELPYTLSVVWPVSL